MKISPQNNNSNSNKSNTMRCINKVILVGNLTRDPEMRTTESGQNVVTFGIATNREWVTKDGQKKSSAEFHEVVAWGRLAEICEKYLTKGQLVYTEGYLKTRSWETPEGGKKFKTEIVIKDMIRLQKGKDQNDDYETMEYSSDDNDVEDDHEETVVEEKVVAAKDDNSSKEQSNSNIIDIDLGL